MQTHPLYGFGPVLSRDPGGTGTPRGDARCPRRGQEPLLARATEGPAAGHGGRPRPSRPRRAQPRRKPGSAPLPRQTMTEGGQPGGGGTAAASPRPPFPVSAAGPGVTATRRRAGPAPCPHRTGPFSLHHPAGSWGAAPPQGPGREAAVRPPRGAPGGCTSPPTGPGAAAPASGAAGGPAVSLGRSCQKARPGRAEPGHGSPGGRASRAGRGTLARRWRRGPRRPSPQGGSHAGCVGALDLLQDPIMLGETLRHLGWEEPAGRAAAGGTGEGPRAEAAAEPGGGPRAAGVAGAGFPERRGADGPGGEGAGEEEQVAVGRARPLRPSPAVPRGPCQGKGCAGGGRGARQSPSAPWASPGAAAPAPRHPLCPPQRPVTEQGRPKRPSSRLRDGRTSCPSRAPLPRRLEGLYGQTRPFPLG